MTTNELDRLDRLDRLRARRAASAAERAAFAELLAHGLRARHAAKLAHLAARKRKEYLEEPGTSTAPEHDYLAVSTREAHQ
jgi:hypothetical protein